MDAICPSAPQAQAPSGILESTAQIPVPIPTAPQAPEPSRPKGLVRVGSNKKLRVISQFFISLFRL